MDAQTRGGQGRCFDPRCDGHSGESSVKGLQGGAREGTRPSLFQIPPCRFYTPLPAVALHFARYFLLLLQAVSPFQNMWATICGPRLAGQIGGNCFLPSVKCLLFSKNVHFIAWRSSDVTCGFANNGLMADGKYVAELWTYGIKLRSEICFFLGDRVGIQPASELNHQITRGRYVLHSPPL